MRSPDNYVEYPYNESPECGHCYTQQADELKCGCWVCLNCGELWPNVPRCGHPDCNFDEAWRYEEWALRPDGTPRGDR